MTGIATFPIHVSNFRQQANGGHRLRQSRPFRGIHASLESVTVSPRALQTARIRIGRGAGGLLVGSQAVVKRDCTLMGCGRRSTVNGQRVHPTRW